MPPYRGVRQMMGVPRVPKAMPTVRMFAAIPVHVADDRYTIVGVTRDNVGDPLPDCTVLLFRTEDDSRAGVVESDASGNFILDASDQLTHYIVGQNVAGEVYGASATDKIGTKHV